MGFNAQRVEQQLSRLQTEKDELEATFESLPMNGVGIWGVIAGLLQLTIPPYAFRLVRLFGAQRVGWFLFSVFTSLAVMHTLERFKPVAGAGGFAVSLDI